MGSFGFGKLAEQTAEHLQAEWESQLDGPGAMIGRSPIEKLLLAALTVQCDLGVHEFGGLKIARKEEDIASIEERFEDRGTLLLIAWPQVPIDNRIADFVFFARDYREETRGQWRRLLVECGGHNYHERTKEQAARDRSKDRSAVLKGYDCFRFTGSELWRDPWDCAFQIGQWAAIGL